MRKLASIREISEVKPIKNADRIEVCVVDGWEVVCKVNEFKPGDRVVYIEIDSIVPDCKTFEFLRDRKFRVKTIKLRGQVSQGLIMPMDILPPRTYKVGEDVTDILNIKKYDPQDDKERKLIKENPPNGKLQKWLMRFGWFKKYYQNKQEKTLQARRFPDWIKKTDEERIQNMKSEFDRFVQEGVEFVATEKIDGCSATYGLKKVNNKFEFVVCSRNVRLNEPDDSCYWNVAQKYDIRAVLESLYYTFGGGYDGGNIVIQGEIVGPGIQGNKYVRDTCEFYAFNLIIDGCRTSYFFMSNRLLSKNIPCVPYIDYITLPDSIQNLVEMSKGRSKLADINREGLVCRSNDYSFKVINPDFLLKEDTE